MARNYTNTSCDLYGTKYCSALNMESCDKCIVSGKNSSEVKNDLDIVFDMLPEDGIYRFFGTEECMLCKGEKKNRTQCYAMTDLGNPEPEKERRNVIGMKTKTMVGSILPMQFSCCKACRSRYNAVSGRHITVTLIAAIVAMGLVNYNPVGEALANISMMLPLALFVIVTGGTWLISKAVQKRLIKKYSELTWFNVMEIPGMEKLEEKNWFELNRSRGISRLIFSNEPLRQGLMTGPVTREENI